MIYFVATVDAKASGFTYDANGNLTKDPTRDIVLIKYNHLNLPTDVYFGNGQRQTMAYHSDGTKRSVSYSQTTASVVGDNIPADDKYSVTTKRTYVGPHIFTDGEMEYSAFEGGYFDPSKGTQYYITDWQGNNVDVINRSRKIVQTTSYYPYGEPTIEPSGQRFLYGGKEREHGAGRNTYDFSARSLIAPLGQWCVPDRLSEKTPGQSIYSYCGGDPINYVDPDGCSTWVIQQPDGRYKVVGGNLNDNDLNIYPVVLNGKDVIYGESIEMTPVITSFYNSDKGEWANDSYIDPNDMSGVNFLDNMTGENTPGLKDYILNARTDHPYDFKVTNGTPSKITGIDIYRGMPMGKSESGKIIYTSARDIGNMVAGYVATAHGLSWIDIRLGFDLYQIYSTLRETGKITFETEGTSSQNAQIYGRYLRLNGR